MKQLPILLLLIVCYYSNAQNNAVIVSMNGIGEIRVGMKKTELEKLTGQSIKLVNLLKKKDWDRDTVQFTYKEIQYQAVMDKDYINDKPDIIVYEIRSSGAQLKTKSGIGIGDDKIRIVEAYPDYMVQIMPDYEKDYTIKSKTKSSVWLFGDDSGKVIVFYLTNNKVTGFCVMYNEGC